MATQYVLDTHALIWHLESNERLGSEARKILDDPGSSLVLPIIALAEAIFIVEKGRTAIPTPLDLIEDVYQDTRIEVLALTRDIVDESLSLTAIPEIHDRLIVATGVYLQSLGETVEILTKDNEIILASLLKIAW